MNKAFVTTRVKYDAKTKKGGICTVLYTFYGEQVLHQSEVNRPKEELKLIGLAMGLEKLEALGLMEVQIDAQLSSETMEQIKTRVVNSTEADGLTPMVRMLNAMTPFYCTFKKGKQNAALAMIEKAEFYAAANVGVGYIPGNETPIIISGPAPVE